MTWTYQGMPVTACAVLCYCYYILDQLKFLSGLEDSRIQYLSMSDCLKGFPDPRKDATGIPDGVVQIPSWPHVSPAL